MSRRPSPLDIIRQFCPEPSGITIGTLVGSGVPVALPTKALRRNVALIAEIGQGKTSLAQELSFSRPFSPHATAYLDYIGSGHAWSQQFVAFMGTIVMILERLMPKVVYGVSPWFLSRHAFATLSYRAPSPIRIDILRRRQRPDGTLESVLEVRDRVMGVFLLRFDDFEVRTRFRRVSSAVITCLIAGGRSICEFERTLRDASFRSFVYAEIRRLGSNDDEVVREEMQKLERICALSPHAFELLIESSINAFEDYAPGTLLGTFLGSPETFDPARAVFGDARFSLTSDVPEDRLKREAFLSVHAIFTSLFALRRAGTGTFAPFDYVLDEIVQYGHHDIESKLAQCRNLDVSVWILFQSMSQWKSVGMEHFPDILAAVCRLRGIWRPTNEREAMALSFEHTLRDPMGELYRPILESTSESTSITESITKSWGNTISNATTHTTSQSSSWGLSRSSQSDASRGQTGDTPTSSTRSGSGSNSSNGGGHTVGDSFQNGHASTDGGGMSRSVAKSIGRVLAETLVRIPCEEQRFIHAQRLMKRKEHQATWLYEGSAIDVNMMPPRQFPERLLGMPILEWYREFHDEYWKSKAVPRATFDPTLYLSAPTPSVPRGTRRRTGSPPIAPMTPAPAPQPEADHADRAQPLTFPPSASALKSAAHRRAALLALIKTVRLPSIAEVMMLTGLGYDTAYRELDALAGLGLVDRIRAFAPRGQGSVPLVYVLTTAGAQELAAAGGDLEDLTRIAKNAAVLRRAVEENRPTQWFHRRSVVTLVSLLAASARTIDPEARVTEVAFDREVVFPVDLTPLLPAMSPRDRALVSPDPTKTTVSYVPDAAFTFEWQVDGKHRSERVFVEVETGLGERDERDLAIGKAWKMRALVAQFPDDAVPRIVVWTPTAVLEQRFFEGSKAVFGESKSPLWLTNGEVLPLAIPTGTSKKDAAASAQALIGNVQEKVWRWLRFPDPSDRRRFVGIRKGA